MKKIWKKWLLISCGLLFSCFCGLLFQNRTGLALEKGDIVLQISPTVQEIALEPGETFSEMVVVQNVGKKDFNFKMVATPYWIKGTTYEPDFEIKNDRTKIADWVSLSEEEGVLAAGQSRKIKYEIRVPEDVPSGGQYMAIMAQTADMGEDNSIIKQSGRVGTLVYARVSGETRASGEILENSIDGVQLGRLLTTTAVVKNTGNVDLKTDVKVVIKNFFTSKEEYNNTEFADTQRVLPETKRMFRKVWERTPKLGIFSVRQEVRVSGGDSIVAEKVVVVCPWWLLILIVIMVTLGICLVLIKIIKRMQYKRKIET